MEARDGFGNDPLCGLWTRGPDGSLPRRSAAVNRSLTVTAWNGCGSPLSRNSLPIGRLSLSFGVACSRDGNEAETPQIGLLLESGQFAFLAILLELLGTAVNPLLAFGE